jgi:hypothetical protein
MPATGPNGECWAVLRLHALVKEKQRHGKCERLIWANALFCSLASYHLPLALGSKVIGLSRLCRLK